MSSKIYNMKTNCGQNLLENVMIYPGFKHGSVLGSNKRYLSPKNVEEADPAGWRKQTGQGTGGST